MEEVNKALQAAANGPMKGILGIRNRRVGFEWIIRGDERSSIVDASLTRVVAGNCVKVFPGTTMSGAIPAACVT